MSAFDSFLLVCSGGYSTINNTHTFCLLRAIPFSKVHWWGPELFGGYLPPQFNFVDLPPPYLRILNSILHLETPCATPSPTF